MWHVTMSAVVRVLFTIWANEVASQQFTICAADDKAAAIQPTEIKAQLQATKVHACECRAAAEVVQQ